MRLQFYIYKTRGTRNPDGKCTCVCDRGVLQNVLVGPFLLSVVDALGAFKSNKCLKKTSHFYDD